MRRLQAGDQQPRELRRLRDEFGEVLAPVAATRAQLLDELPHAGCGRRGRSPLARSRRWTGGHPAISLLKRSLKFTTRSGLGGSTFTRVPKSLKSTVSTVRRSPRVDDSASRRTRSSAAIHTVATTRPPDRRGRSVP